MVLELDHAFIWKDGEEDYGLTYRGTRVGDCFHCYKTLENRVYKLIIERYLGDWNIPTCEVCVDIDNRPCEGYHERGEDGYICKYMDLN